MSNKMLIDASHPEETRVVVVSGNRIEEFDFESEHKKQLKGNIYLARVTRVEPSLQAAFVEYGGNRHGFLAFSEIHPDYYQIPLADRQALLEAEEKAVKAESDAEDKETQPKRTKKKKISSKAKSINDEIISEDIDSDDDFNHDNTDNEEETIEIVGAEDALEEVPDILRLQRKEYQIQEVIKRRQILLVQVVKEERGNKGAALTTYLSLAGRYSVLMPNTARGGGISRKITNPQDRKRLKDVVKGLDVPRGMGVILRTAGANRTKVEIKRDYEYLMRLWDNVRTLTMESTAPTLVYEEGSLIKRSIRDLYNKDISEILVAGDTGYREAKDFMRMLMPSHAKVVQAYREALPIFARNGIEAQLDNMVQPQVTLKSGGYLVINQTEALVAIDVNSGRSTKEHSIEETAIQTNLEAAEEVARQLRLRDLAGLVVIDFIDMEEKRNIRAVEKKLKDCLKEDRARIQVGRISHFGLMEMSRQRIRASVLESTMQTCPHCLGTGHIRSDSSMALHIIRSIEEYLLRNPGHDVTVRTSVINALYVLNNKRDVLADIESRFNVTISVEADDNVGAQHLAIYKGDVSTRVADVPVPTLPLIEEIDEPELIAKNDKQKISQHGNDDQNSQRRDKNNRHKNQSDEINTSSNKQNNKEQRSRHDNDEERRRKRRRGRRGGRRYRDHDDRHYLPYAEPVGPFAVTALAEIRTARQQQRALNQQRRIPHAEPVGPMFTIILDEKATTQRNNKSHKNRRNNQNRRKSSNTETVVSNFEVVAATNVDQNTVTAPVHQIEQVKEDVKPAKKSSRKKVDTSTKTNDVKAETKSDVDENEKSIERIEIKIPKDTKKTTEKSKTTRKKKVDTKTEEVVSENVSEPEKKEKAKSKAKTTTKAKAVAKAKTDKTLDSEEKKTAPKTKSTTKKVAVKKETASTTSKKTTSEQDVIQPIEPVVTSSDETKLEDKKPKRGGWWQRKGFF